MTAASVTAGRLPITLGGDHSLAAGSIPGVARALRARGEELAVVWMDAHADMNTPETSPSGNVHGMPLAAVLGIGPAALAAIGGGTSIRPSTSPLIGAAQPRRARKGLRPPERSARLHDDRDRIAAGWARSSTKRSRRWRASAGGIQPELDLDGLDPERRARGRHTRARRPLLSRSASPVRDGGGDRPPGRLSTWRS